MSPAKNKGSTKEKSNAETASNISVEVSESSERSQKKGRGKKATEKEVDKVEKVIIEAKENVDNDQTEDVEVTEPKEPENGDVNEEAVEENMADKEVMEKTGNEKMEVDQEVSEKKAEEDVTENVTKKKVPTKKAANVKSNKRDKAGSQKEDHVYDDETKEKESRNNEMVEKASEEDKMEVDADDKKDDEVEEKKAAKNKKKAPAKRASKTNKNKRETQKEESDGKNEKLEDKNEDKVNDDQPKDMEAEKPTRGKRKNKVEEEKKEEEDDKQANTRPTRQKKEEHKKAETPKAKKGVTTAKEEKKAEMPKGKKGAKNAEAAKDDEGAKSEVVTKKATAAKKGSNAKEVGKAKDKQKEIEKEKVAAAANSRKRKADTDAKDTDKQGNKKTKFAFEIPAEPLKPNMPGDVLSMGESDVGQLGLGPDVMEMSRPKKVTLGNDKIVQISAGGMHSLCVTKNGEIYSFGCNDEATLGRVTEEEDDCAVPRKVVGIEGKVVQAIAGDSHSVALTEEGQVYIWGTFRDTNGVIGINPGEESGEVSGKSSGKRKQENGKEMGKSEKVEKPSKILQGVKVTKIAGGSAHILCLTNKGEVYSLGASDLGQLGRVGGWFSVRGGRLGLDSTLNAKPVRFNKRGLKCVDIWAGAYGSFAKSSEGEILSWGLNNYHQLGFPDKENRMFPEVVTTFDPTLDWKDIACAEHHTIALDGSGKVYCIGRKDYGRLGLGSLEKIDHIEKLTIIESLASKKCISVGCGTSVSFAVADDGTIYGWGMGSTKQLGTGDDEADVLEPTPIKGKQLDNLKGIMAVAGGQHTLLLATERN